MEEKLLSLLPYAFTYLPLESLEPLARRLSALIYPFLTYRRKIAMANLDLAFGKRLSKKEKDAILKRNLFYFTRNVLELGKVMFLPPSAWLSRWEIKGEEHLKAAYLKGKGVIIVSAHMGNFPLMISLFALKGYRIAVVAKVPQKGVGGRVIKLFEQKFGIRFIYARENRKAALACAKLLKKGNIIFVQLDQNAAFHKAMIDFFGYPVPVPRSPAVLAQKTGAAIVPVFAFCKPGLGHKVICEPEVKIKPTANKEKDIHHILTILTQIIEKYARLYPEQWWWWHRRFKEHISY
jgi:KDO2-lipid IV(A) lauroyltransferase